MEDKKKVFVIPVADITNFSGEDIITMSVYDDSANWWEDPDGDGDDF